MGWRGSGGRGAGGSAQAPKPESDEVSLAASPKEWDKFRYTSGHIELKKFMPQPTSPRDNFRAVPPPKPTECPTVQDGDAHLIDILFYG